VLFFGLSSLLAQTKQISGLVTDADDGAPVPGVSVVVKGTTTGTITDSNGNYSLTVPVGEVLVFSFVGMKAKEIPIGAESVYNVNLEAETIGVEEVVVTAMGIKRDKKALGYSVSEFSGEDFGNVGNEDATKALQGKVAGVSISAGSGAPVAATRVLVR